MNFFKPNDFNIETSKVLVPLGNRPDDSVNDFTPIGIGSPLVIRLHTLYVGDLRKGFLTGKQSILVTSVIKDDVTYEIPPRGVHQIFQKVDHRDLLYPSASNEGTQLIYYTKAFDAGRLMVDIEVKADRFNNEAFEDIGSSLMHAAGLPVFTPFSSFLLAGSQLMKIGGNVANRIVDKVPMLRYTFNISDDVGGITDTQSGYLIGVDKDYAEVFKNCKIVQDEYNPGNIYIEKNGKKYDGGIPYIVISLDGRSKFRYDNFKATIASASILKKFYDISGTTNVEDIQNMMGLYNDYTYIEKIKKVKALIKES